MAIAENSYPQKIGHSCLKFLDPKIWLSSEIPDPKNMARTPPYAKMASTPLGASFHFGVII